MADESIIVKQQGTIFLGGPPLVSEYSWQLCLYDISLIEVVHSYFPDFEF